jgi:hypothetical protein
VEGVEDCDPNPCPGEGYTWGEDLDHPMLSVAPVSWGTVKSLYR